MFVHARDDSADVLVDLGATDDIRRATRLQRGRAILEGLRSQVISQSLPIDDELELGRMLYGEVAGRSPSRMRPTQGASAGHRGLALPKKAAGNVHCTAPGKDLMASLKVPVRI